MKGIILAGQRVTRFNTITGTTSSTAGNMSTHAHGLTDITGIARKPTAVFLTALATESDGTATTAAAVGAVTKSDATAEGLTVGGTYTGRTDADYKVVVTHISTTDVIGTQVIDKVSVFVDGVFEAEYDIVTTSAKTISNGLTLTFAATGTTTTVGDYYTFSATAGEAVASANPMTLVEFDATNIKVRCATASQPFQATVLY